MTRRYLKVDPKLGYPLGPKIFYECLRCDAVVPSEQQDVAACKCGNISFDIGRLDVEDEAKFRMFTT